MEHKEFATALRRVADWIEQHPEVDLPEPELTAYSLYTKEKAAVTARALAMGGRCDKVFEDIVVRLKRDFGGVLVQYLGTRSNVCEQRAVGKRVVPEQYVAPKPAVEGHVIPEHEETVYEWVCAPLLGKPQIEEGLAELAAVGAAPLQLEAGDADIPF